MALPTYEDPCGITEPRLFVTIDTGTDLLKYGVQPLRDSAALGGFAEPRVLSCSPIVRSASDPSTGSWSAQSATVSLADTDRANRARSATRTSFRNSAASVYLTSNARRLSGGQPRLMFAGTVYSDTAGANLALGLEINDLIGNSYSLFSEEKQIPQRAISVVYFPNASEDAIDRGEPILCGRLAPLNALRNGEGVVDCPTVGLVTLNGTITTPTGTTLTAVVADLQASVTAGTLYTDYGSRIGFSDAIVLQGMGTVPSTYAGLAAVIGFGDLDALLATGAVTGGNQFVCAVVASHAISEILDASNGNPSIWINDIQVDPAQIGVSVWAPQIPGDGTWAAMFGADPFTDIVGTDGTTRRYTLIAFDPASEYGRQVLDGARVHVDCVGLETDGDGGGAAITDIYELYRHVLVNFMLQDYQSGAWLTVPTFLFSDGVTTIDRVDAASFTTASTIAALSLAGGVLGSFKIGDRSSIRDVVARFNVSAGSLLGVDDYQRIFIKKLDTRRTQFLAGHRTLRDKVDLLPGFSIEPKPEWQVNRLTYQYARNYYTNTIERGASGGGVEPLQDTTSQVRDGVISKTMELPYLRDDASALAVANYYLALFADMPHVVRYARIGLCGLEDDILDGIPITHWNGYGATGWNDHAVWVLSKTFNGKTNTCDFTALDVDGLLT